MRTLAIITTLALTLPVAHGRSRTKPLGRFHLVSSALQKRLSASAGMKHNLRSVGQLHHGSAFLVERPHSDGSALMLTARHVLTSCKPGRTRVQFQPDGVGGRVESGTFRRVVVQSSKLDYALVEVSLPARLRGLEPVRLAPGPGSGKRLYTVGYPLVETSQYLAGNRTNRRLVRTSLNGVVLRHGGGDKLRTKTIASGTEDSAGRVVPIQPRLALFGRPLFPVGRARHRVRARLPAAGGSSGSPVFSAESHQVRGIATLGGASGEATPLQWLWARLRGRRLRGRWQTGYTPISVVKKDVASLIERGGLDAGDRARLKRLLAR